MTNNFIRGVGRLVTDRFDFQDHVDGTRFGHKGSAITLDPPIVVNSVEYTNLQAALEASEPYLQPPTIPDASVSTKGLIQLAGDLYGSATNVVVSGIRQRPISTSPPNTSDVLTWNGATWEPAAIPVQIALTNDLDGTPLSPQVIRATGVADFFTMKCSHINFLPDRTPSIEQTTSGSGAGRTMSISSQSSLYGNGADLVLTSGFGTPTHGSVDIRVAGLGATLIEASAPRSTDFVLSLVKGTKLTTTEMPTGTGSRVIYIANADTVPTVSPASGAILYADSGELWSRPSTGASFKLSGDPIIYYSYGSHGNSYDEDMGQWTPIYSTTSRSYVYEETFSTPGVVTVQTGDIVKVHLSGYVGNNSSSYHGYLKLYLAGRSSGHDIPGGECMFENSSMVQKISVSGSYVITGAESGDEVCATFAMKTEVATPIQFYGGAHISIEVIRHSSSIPTHRTIY
jgi:hypothetical protein